MSHIMLTEEQVRMLEAGQEPVEIHAPDGRVLGFVRLLDALDLEALRNLERARAERGRGVPGQRVLALLRKAHEIDQYEGMTPEKMGDLVRQALAGEEP